MIAAATRHADTPFSLLAFDATCHADVVTPFEMLITLLMLASMPIQR